MHMHFGIEIGEGARRGDAIFQRKAGTRRRLRAIRQNPPVAVRATADLEGAEMQMMPAIGLQARRWA